VTGLPPTRGRNKNSLSLRERTEGEGGTVRVKQARHLRKTATAAEKRLWSRLRNRQLADLKFRRQHVIGDRIVDFFCEEAKLAVELDGSGHRRHFTEMSDLDREIELYEKGVRVIRFHNRAVLFNLDSVLNAIIYAVDPEKSLWPPRRSKRN
jgi:very-short-patch-repair endonuclease